MTIQFSIKSHLIEFERTNQKNTLRVNSKKQVLVVDDDASMLAIISDVLSRLDYDVTTASSGAEGLKQFHHSSFDLVVTDCIMPGTDGWQLAALIKQLSAHTPIIMVTGQNKYDVMDKMQGGDIDFMIFKPFKLNDFYEAVRSSFEIKLT